MHNVKLLPSLLLFADVAKYQSFTKAAEHNQLSKSSVSQHIRRLENHIGQQLLSRHTRGMSLTSTGAKLLLQCELLQEQVNSVLNELDSNKESPSGKFAISIPHSFEKSIVIPALSQLCNEYPLLQPNLIVTDKPLDLIEDKLDVCIYGGDLKDSNYRAVPIGSATEVLCAAPGYLTKYSTINKLEQLSQHKFVITPWQSNQLEFYKDNQFENILDISVKFSAQTNALPSAIEMVCKGMGLGLLPKFSLQEKILNNELVLLLDNYSGKQWPFYFVHRFQGDKPLHVTRFYQLVRHFFNKTLSS